MYEKRVRPAIMLLKNEKNGGFRNGNARRRKVNTGKGGCREGFDLTCQ